MRISRGRLTPFIWSGHSNTGSLVLDGSGRSLFYRNCSRFLLHQSVYLLRIYSTTYSTDIFNEYKLIAVSTLLTRDLVPFGAMFILVVLFKFINVYPRFFPKQSKAASVNNNVANVVTPPPTTTTNAVDEAATKPEPPPTRRRKKLMTSRPSAMDLIQTSPSRRSMWAELPEVVESGVLGKYWFRYFI